MNNNSSFNGRNAAGHAALAVTLALLAGLPACGDLDENDADPPSVNALAALDASHLVAVRSNYRDPVILDAQTGARTGMLTVAKYYDDVAAIGNGELVYLQNQSIDFYRADGTMDATRSIVEPQITSMAVSADHSTLAWAVAMSVSENTVRIADLSTGVQRDPAPDVTFNMGLSISRDGNLVAFDQADVEVLMTHAPGTRATCLLDSDQRHAGAAVVTAFSPAADKLAVTNLDGRVNIFDLGHFPDCTLAVSSVPSEGNPPSVGNVQFSPDGALLAISVEQTAASPAGEPLATTGVVRVLDVATAALLKELPVYQWQKTSDPSNYSPYVTDLQWSETGDRLTVSTARGPVQQWDVASGTHLWSAAL
jgi:WD40 repeat protein